MIYLFRPTLAPTDTLLAALRPVFDSKYTGEGPRCAELEAALCARVGHPNVALVNSGSSALMLAYWLAGIGPGTRVVTTPLTCLLATEPLLHLGADIVWADVDPTTGELDSAAVSTACGALDGTPLVILTCDWGGSTSAMRPLADLAARVNATLIEDAAHAFGGTYDDGTPVGSGLADLTAFSFQSIKSLSMADGGALACRYPHHAAQARLARWAGLDRSRGESMRCYQQVPFPGFKFQQNDILAAVGLANLAHLDGWIATAREQAAAYDAIFRDVPGVRPLTRSAGSSCWLYPVAITATHGKLTDPATQFTAAMRTRGIEVSAVHARNDTQRIFHGRARWGSPSRGLDALTRALVHLPIGPHLSAADVVAVADAARECVG